MGTKLGRMVTYLKGLLTIKPHNSLITSYKPIRDKRKSYLYYQSAYGTKLNRMVIYFERLLTIRIDHVVSQDHVTNKNHYTTRVPMATNLAEWQITLMSSYL